MLIDDAAIWMIIIRLVLPFTILRFPLLGTLLNAYVDVVDYGIIGDHPWYQSIDKLLDLYYLSFSAYVVLRWRDMWARWIALAAYVWRIMGVGIFLLVQQQWVLFVFPNFFEVFFIFYFVFIYTARWVQHPKETWQSIIQGKKESYTYPTMMTSTWVVIVVVASLLVPKLVQEYVLHIYLPARHLAPEWIHEVIVLASQHSWAVNILYVLPPLGVVLYMIMKLKKTG